MIVTINGGWLSHPNMQKIHSVSRAELDEYVDNGWVRMHQRSSKSPRRYYEPDVRSTINSLSTGRRPQVLKDRKEV